MKGYNRSPMRVARRVLGSFAIAIIVSVSAVAGELVQITGTQNSLRASAQDVTFGATGNEVERKPAALPYVNSFTVTQGFSSSANHVSLTDDGLSLSFHHVLSGYADSFAASGGQVSFIPAVDLHYEVTGSYVVTSPADHPAKIDQDFFLNGTSTNPFWGSNQGNSPTDGTTITYTAGTDAGTSHLWQGKPVGTLFAGQTYTLAYQNYVSSPAAGVPNGTVADALIDVALFRRGDTNGDHAVDFNDLVTLAQHYNTTVGPGAYRSGDFDGDGMVTFVDLVILAQQYNAPVPKAVSGMPAQFRTDVETAFASVPEPSLVGWLAGCLVLIGARRQRAR